MTTERSGTSGAVHAPATPTELWLAATLPLRVDAIEKRARQDGVSMNIVRIAAKTIGVEEYLEAGTRAVIWRLPGIVNAPALAPSARTVTAPVYTPPAHLPYTAAQLADRLLAIACSDAAVGREALAEALVRQPGLTVTAALVALRAAPQSGTASIINTEMVYAARQPR
jgi:hypothetical protein